MAHQSLTADALHQELDVAQATIAELRERLARIESSSETRCQDILDQQTDLICRYDANFRLTYANRVYAERLGQPYGALLGSPILNWIPDAEREQVIAKVRALTPDQPIATTEHPSFGPDGSMSWYEWTDRALFDADGTLLEYQAVGHDITRRKEAEQRLRLLEAAFIRSDDAILITDAELKIVQVNAAFTRITGYTAADVIGINPVSLLNGPASLRAAGHANGTNFQYLPLQGKLKVNRKDGERIDIAWTSSPIVDAEDTITNYVTILRDVTEQEAYIQLLDEAWRFATASLDALVEHVAILMPDGRISHVNTAWKRFAESNHAPADTTFVGTNYLAICDSACGAHSEEAAEVAAGIRAVISGASDEYYLEYPCHSPTERRWFGLRVSPFAEPPPRRVAVAHVPITERKEAEAMLQFQANVLQQVSDAIIATDPAARITAWNQAATQIYGWTEAEALGQDMDGLLHSEAVDETLTETEQARASGEPWYRELRQRTKSGQRRFIAASVRQLRDERGRIVGGVTVARDITEQRRLDRLQTRLSQVLEMIADDQTLKVILERLILAVEEYQPELIASILLYDPATNQLRYGAAPSLPTSYLASTIRVDVGPSAGSCGTAAHLKGLVIVEDIAADPLWVNFRLLALSHNLRACWSQPILNRDGSVLGTFALYYDHPRRPDDSNLELIRLAAHVAGIAIRRVKEQDARRQAETELQQAHDQLEARVAERTAELERIKNRIEAIFNHSGDGIVLVDVQTGVRQANLAFERMFGLPNERYIGHQFTDFVHAEDAAALADALRDLPLTGGTRRLEMRARRSDGSYFDVEISVAPVNQTEQAVNSLVCIIRDVTERKQVQQAVAEERNLLRTLIDAVPDFIYIKDRQHRMVLNNIAHLRSLTAASVSEVIGKTDFEMFPTALATKFHADEVELFRTGQPILNTEERSIGEDGREIWAMTTKVPLRNLSGEVIGLVGITHDVTPIKASEEALRRSQADLTSIIDSTNLAFVLLDRDGIVRIVNRQAVESTRERYGVTMEAGHSIMDYIPPRFHAPFRDMFRRVLAGESIITEELLNAPGGTRYFEFRYFPVRTDDGEIVGVTMAFENITQRKENEQKLRYLASLQEHMHDAVISTDLHLNIQSWNRAAERLFGWSQGEALGRSLNELLGTQYATGETWADVGQHLSEHGFWSGEAVQLHRDRSRVYVWGSTVISRDETGKPVGIISVNHDITARKQAEQALERVRAEEREMQQYLKALHEISLHLARTESLDEFYRATVECSQKYFGFDRVSLLLHDPQTGEALGTYGTDLDGRIVSEAHHQFDPGAMTGILKRTTEQAERFCFDAEARLYADGQPIGMGWNAVAALWNGELLGWLAADNALHHGPARKTQLDILRLYALTVGSLLARKRAEHKLLTTTQRLELATEAANIGIWDWDIPNNHLMWDDRMCGLYGIAPEQFDGTFSAWERGVHSEDLERAHQEMTLALQAEKTFSTEYRVVWPDGAVRHIQANALVRRDEQGVPIRMTGAHLDITERKQALLKEKELGELKSRFVSMASHEFRTPLATILALTETLSVYRAKLSDGQIAQKLSKIRAQVGHLQAIMEDVLQLAKMQSRRVSLNPVRLSLDALFFSVLDEFESSATMKHRLVYSRADGLEEAMLDKKLIQQVISNLVSNAIKYSAEGKTIFLRLERQDEMLVLTVQDEGIGIPEADLKHMFEPFHRASNVGTISGTGLGLVIARESVELHGGTISVASEIGVGTTFTVRIPHGIEGAEGA